MVFDIPDSHPKFCKLRRVSELLRKECIPLHLVFWSPVFSYGHKLCKLEIIQIYRFRNVINKDILKPRWPHLTTFLN